MYPVYFVTYLSAGHLAGRLQLEKELTCVNRVTGELDKNRSLVKIFFFGVGYCARRLIEREPWIEASGTARTPERVAALRREGVEAYRFDDAEADLGLEPALERAEAIIVSIPPRAGTGATLDRFRAAIAAAPALKRVVYYSTIGVYGDHGGAWVDETSATLTRTARGLARLEEEARWAAAARERGVEADILRLAGIYGPRRNALINLREGQARRIVKPGQVFNRAHVDDIAEVSRLVLTRGLQGQIWNVADEEPSPPEDVVSYASALLGLPPLPEERFEEARLSARAEEFYAEQASLDRQGQSPAGIYARLSDLSRGAQSARRGGRGAGRMKARQPRPLPSGQSRP
jgi:nucleoside-diphosphate-sugar epimerase